MKKKQKIIAAMALTLVVFMVGFVITSKWTPKEFYPETSEAPELEFLWDGELVADNIIRITPYGILEGGKERFEPAVEMQFYTKSNHDEVLAPASGIITQIEKNWASLTVRYGENYGYTMHHIVDIPEDIEIGARVEVGDLLGYTELRNGEGWWEIELNTRRGDVYRSLPAYDYFSENSKKELDRILAAQKIYGFPSWSIRESYVEENGNNVKSWIEMIGSDEWWSSSQRIGINEWKKESEAEFMSNNGIIPDEIMDEYNN